MQDQPDLFLQKMWVFVETREFSLAISANLSSKSRPAGTCNSNEPGSVNRMVGKVVTGHPSNNPTPQIWSPFSDKYNFITV